MIPTKKTSGSTADSDAEVKSGTFPCCMINKHNQLTTYTMELTEQALNIVSNSSGQVKLSEQLDELTIRFDQKRQIKSQEPTCFDDATQAAQDEGQVEQTHSWYPLKMLLPEQKYRQIYFESRMMRR